MTPMMISAQFATSLQSPAHIAVAERLGYDRAWLFDTPHESPDVWMILAMAAERTTTIGLGPGVLVPTLRHPMVTRRPQRRWPRWRQAGLRSHSAPASPALGPWVPRRPVGRICATTSTRSAAY